MRQKGSWSYKRGIVTNAEYKAELLSHSLSHADEERTEESRKRSVLNKQKQNTPQRCTRSVPRPKAEYGGPYFADL